MASVLFIAPADLGEVVLATGALAYVLRNDDALTILCGADAIGLFRAVPGPATTLSLGGRGDAGARVQIWLRLLGARFDTVIDGRGGLFGRAISANRRVALMPSATIRHRVEDWADALGVEGPVSPKLWLDEHARLAAAAYAPGHTPILVLAPGGAAEAKRWPPERFAAVARRLAGGLLSGARIVVLGAADRDGDIASAIVTSLDADGLPALDLGRGEDILSAAALLERATLCIGNDNALTHIAAAAGAATVTLFGPTDERVRAPCGPRTRTLRGRPLSLVHSELDACAAMEEISIDAVEAAALDLLRAGGLQ